MKVSEIRVIFHGVRHAQYFQGHGVSFTTYTDCATGASSSYFEALDDALEQLATGGIEIPDNLLREAVFEECGLSLERLEDTAKSDRAALHGGCFDRRGEDMNEAEHDDCELNYYVSVDVKVS